MQSALAADGVSSKNILAAVADIVSIFCVILISTQIALFKKILFVAVIFLPKTLEFLYYQGI